MTFKMWSAAHVLLMAAPFLLAALLWLLLRGRSTRAKYICGCVLGVLSLIVLVVRNAEMIIKDGFDPDVIPFQVCHFGNIMVFVSLVFKNKVAALMAWCMNMPAAYGSLVFAYSLEFYDTVFVIHAQSYIWGHILIVAGALYPIVLRLIKPDLKSFFIGVGVITVFLMIPAIVLNSYFNNVMGLYSNYFFMYSLGGTPLDYLYNTIGSVSTYGWFRINWGYVLILYFASFAAMLGLYFLAKLICREPKQKAEKSAILKEPPPT